MGNWDGWGGYGLWRVGMKGWGRVYGWGGGSGGLEGLGG